MSSLQKISPFTKLNVIQFLAAINENLYKLLAAFFLISEYGTANTSSIMALIGALFILPFLLFSSLGGIFADKMPKSYIVTMTRFLEFCCLLLGLALFGFHLSDGAYVILFLMASLSAIFGPSKYGIIPELIDSSRILFANSIIAAFTFLGIIIGTTLASFMVWLTNENYSLALLSSIGIALAGWMISLSLPKTPTGNREKPFRIFIYREHWESIKAMRLIPNMNITVFAYSYFLFIGAFVQLNIIPYTIKILHFSDVVGGYFFLVTAFGLGLGAYFTDRISHGKIRLEIIPLSGYCISLLFLLMKWVYTPWPLILIWLLFLGFFGGMFLVPSQAYILAFSPQQDRGRNFATANFLSFFFALLASLAIFLLNSMMNLSPSTSFVIIGGINLLIIFFIQKKLKT